MEGIRYRVVKAHVRSYENPIVVHKGEQMIVYRRIVWIIFAISLLCNVILGGMMFYQNQITKKSQEYASFSLIAPRLAMAQEYADCFSRYEVAES
jgi:uncharacterized iron-regulated membrane protein